MLLPTGQSIEQKIASLIVYMITPDNNVQEHLKSLLNAMKGYFHPSNHGSWSAFLGVIVHKLGECFARRLHEERQPECATYVAFWGPFAPFFSIPMHRNQCSQI